MNPALLNTAVEVFRMSEVDDGTGVFNKTYTSVLSTKGRMTQLDAREIEENAKRGFVTTHRTYMPVVDVRMGDRLTVNGKNYEVKRVNNPMELNRFLQVDSELKQ